MDINQVSESARAYLIKKNKDFGNTDLVIHSDKAYTVNGRLIFEADVSYVWQLNSHEKQVRRTIVMVYGENRWLCPDFRFEE